MREAGAGGRGHVGRGSWAGTAASAGNEFLGAGQRGGDRSEGLSPGREEERAPGS